jgi:hypothetical protein
MGAKMLREKGQSLPANLHRLSPQLLRTKLLGKEDKGLGAEIAVRELFAKVDDIHQNPFVIEKVMTSRHFSFLGNEDTQFPDYTSLDSSDSEFKDTVRRWSRKKRRYGKREGVVSFRQSSWLRPWTNLTVLYAIA